MSHETPILFSQRLNETLLCVQCLWLNLPKGLSAHEIAYQTGLSDSTIELILECLWKTAFVEKNSEDTYYLQPIYGISFTYFACTIENYFFNFNSTEKNVIPLYPNIQNDPIKKMNRYLKSFFEELYLENLLKESIISQQHRQKIIFLTYQ